MKTVLVTGGAGYIGALLTPKLLEREYRVRVLDLFLFGDGALPTEHPLLECIRGDVRDSELMERVVPGADAIIHLAGISNDPGFELNPKLVKSINLDSFEPFVALAKRSGVERFLYASTATVYGATNAQVLTEDQPLAPITDYDRYKAQCEGVLFNHNAPGFTTVSIRAATVCGYSPRPRLDLVVNILTNLAVHRRKITLLGTGQQRANLHVDDLTDLYVDLLEQPAEAVAGQSFNAAHENHTVERLSAIVGDVIRQELPGASPMELESAPVERGISLNVCSERIRDRIGWRPKRSVENAVTDLCRAFRDGKLPNALTDPRYYNVKMIQSLGLV